MLDQFAEGLPEARHVGPPWGLKSALMAYATRTNDGLAMILLQRILSLAVSLAIVVLLRRAIPRSVGLATAGVVIASGVFDTLANVFYVLGVQAGFASIVATGSGVYPIIPALLGITVMGSASRRISTSGSPSCSRGS